MTMTYTAAQLADLQCIRECAQRYCRGVDRLDLALMQSAYWPEATDDHGVFVGNAFEFAERCMQSHRKWRATSHCIMNHHIELDADGAHARGEIYNVTYLFQKDADVLDTWHGRYLDAYEKRGDAWRIIERVCVHEGTHSQAIAAMNIDAMRREAALQRERTLATLWNPQSSFFEVVREQGGHAQVREAIGFLPWYFGLPPSGQGYEQAWSQLTDEDGFRAPKGLTTAERRHPEFRSHGTGTCEWDGAVWPYATSQTLTALGNVLRDYEQDSVSKADFVDAFLTYTRSHRFDGLPYIGEYHDEINGNWLKGVSARSKFYHHSTYADLLIANLVGLRPKADRSLVWDPLLQETDWPWFALDGVPYKGRILTLLWDEDGSRYGQGKGMTLLVDGTVAGRRETLGKMTIALD